MQNNNKQRKKIKKPDPLGNPLYMGRYGIKEIRNIAFGNCKNIEELIDLFGSNRILVQNTINEVNEKIEDARIIYDALYVSYIREGNINPRIGYLVNKYYKMWEAWNLVKTVLTQIYDFEDGTPLYTLVNRLPSYKQCL